MTRPIGTKLILCQTAEIKNLENIKVNVNWRRELFGDVTHRAHNDNMNGPSCQATDFAKA